MNCPPSGCSGRGAGGRVDRWIDRTAATTITGLADTAAALSDSHKRLLAEDQASEEPVVLAVATVELAQLRPPTGSGLRDHNVMPVGGRITHRNQLAPRRAV